ncbi:MAG: hypothetical protein QXZ17_05580 [Nitrososphaerota archaeon]
MPATSETEVGAVAPGPAAGPAAAEPVPGGPYPTGKIRKYYFLVGKQKYLSSEEFDEKEGYVYLIIEKKEYIESGATFYRDAGTFDEVTVRCPYCFTELMVYYDYAAYTKVVTIGSCEHFLTSERAMCGKWTVFARDGHRILY